MTTLLRFGLKASIFGGAVYYSKKIGVWDDSSRTYALTGEATAFVKPYLQPIADNVRKELPIQVTDLPSSDDICRTLTAYWNKGVIVSIDFTRNLPKLVSCYINKGVTYIVNEVQKEKKEPAAEK